MLTIQPNFSQRLHSQPLFKGKYDDAEDVLFVDDVEDMGDIAEFTNSNPRNLPVLASTYAVDEDKPSSDEDLKGLSEDINDAIKGVKKLEDKIPDGGKKVINGLCLLGSGAVVTIGTKLGWSESGKLLTKIFKNPAVVKCKENLGKFGKKIAKSFASLKESAIYKSTAKKFGEWGESFAKTKFGGKVCDFFRQMNESKPVVALKSLFKKTKNLKAGQISDTTGDIVSVSTGVSTAVAGSITDDKKKTKENAETKMKQDDVTLDEDDYNVVD